ncbi:AsnC family transcriptional regulator [Erwinia sp. OLTSP20]|uniref:Lrp/AsnC family transcriptional regulator n=1 Tax=unclassified Erwinia TaxID=2622719 RepID=UPI000C541EAF|nr:MULTISPECIES: Lrp/AsnC family transcriptional regulator [unclassified Erwinia]PIJ48556.1 AsnC family transcriptional regulator [Erwinia sp. OAMSP11]PIJ68287.1 AsnC family transcriptional regulator [Erwinia sp. OLSSP12]PIJ78809.1 AsnC family transcriptional regulator [Erwinia sp. OLCASP19]PIJ79968.1 AsnC family transcriptional regulator [Erwinia sp. OLMTSP26]PIJ80345.1 AsnC family transcriptional regulator [Erwinia sp. OLMDSP33]
MTLDDFDLKMLALLQANGRLTNQELSELIGLSASQCSRRRISLEQAGCILGYHARLSADAIGTPVTGLIEVRLIHHTQEDEASFYQLVLQQDAIQDAWKTTGDADYLLKVTVRDLPALSALISQLVSGHHSVSHVKTSVVLNRLKENGVMSGKSTLRE